jgi:superfamily II DNA or RNA helicase
MNIDKNGLTPKDLRDLKNDLTVIPENTFGNFQITPIKVFIESKDILTIPTLYKSGPLVFPQKNYVRLEDTIILRDSQINCYNKCILEFDKEYGGGIISLNTGQGKTVISIKLIAYSGLKTIIIVNKIELMDQWIREINTFIPNVKVGIIQGKFFAAKDCDIVIAMLQTVSTRESLITENFKDFSLAIYDEVHNVSTNVFSKALFKLRPRYTFGLTATLHRKDGMEKIIKWFIGEVLHSDLINTPKQTTEIRIYKYSGKSSVEYLLKDGTPSVSKMLTNIAEDTTRNKLLLRIITDLKNRMILIVSDRISQLKFLHKNLIGSGLMIGGMTATDKTKSKECRIILGTYQIVSEGFNLPKLNTLLFATPRSNVTQCIGRIYRKTHDVIPIIIDIVDEFSLFKTQQYKRRNIYKKNIEYCKITVIGDSSEQSDESDTRSDHSIDFL